MELDVDGKVSLQRKNNLTYLMQNYNINDPFSEERITSLLKKETFCKIENETNAELRAILASVRSNMPWFI